VCADVQGHVGDVRPGVCVCADVQGDAGREADQVGRVQEGGQRANTGALRRLLRHQASHTCREKRYDAHCHYGI